MAQAGYWILLLICLQIVTGQSDVADWKAISDGIDDLEAELKEIEQLVPEISRMDKSTEKTIIKARGELDDLEGAPCWEFHQFQCGFHKPKCITDYLMCDGVPDCENGADESICDLPFERNTLWVAFLVPDYYNCIYNMPWLQPVEDRRTKVEFTITDDPIMPSRPLVSADSQVLLTNGRYFKWLLYGTYHWPTRRLFIWSIGEPMFYGYALMPYDGDTGILEFTIYPTTRISVLDKPCGQYNMRRATPEQIASYE